MVNTKERRRRYLVNKKLQLQFSLLLVIQAGVPIILLGIVLYIVNKKYLITLQRIIGEAALCDPSIQNILTFSMLAVVVLLITTTVLLTFIGIRFSHRIAGPLYKLEESMERLARGEKIDFIHFRKTDIVNSLSDKFNAIIARLNQTRQ